MSSIFWLVVGAFIGWHVPQPTWASGISEKLKALFNAHNRK